MNAVFPAVDRVRRSASEEHRTYIDSIVLGMGAVMGKQNVRGNDEAKLKRKEKRLSSRFQCRQRVTCSAGKSLRYHMPGAQVAVMLMENMVPDYW